MDDNLRDQKYLSAYMVDAFKRSSPRDDMTLKIHHDSILEGHLPNISIDFKQQSHDFLFGHTPFNPKDAEELVRDKWSMYQKTKDALPWPHTEMLHKTSKKTTDDVTAEIITKINDPEHPFTFPLVLKPNRGSLSRNVHIAHDEDELHSAIKSVRSEGSQGALMLIQEYLGDDDGFYPEFRAVCFDGKAIITFDRRTDQDIPADVLTDPGHWPGVALSEVKDEKILNQMNDIAAYLKEEHGVSYIAFDMKRDREGNVWVMEGNTSPMGYYRIENDLPEGRERITELTDLMIAKIQATTAPPANAANDENYRANNDQSMEIA